MDLLAFLESTCQKFSPRQSMPVKKQFAAVVLFLSLCPPLGAQVKSGSIALQANRPLQNLRGSWHFIPADVLRPLTGSGQTDWTTATKDIAGWRQIPVPAQWHQLGILYNGIGTYRLNVETDATFRERGLALSLTYISMAHEVYFNGRLIGTAGRIGQDGSLLRGHTGAVLYTIPPEYIKSTTNELFVRVKGFHGLGGFLMPYQYIGFPERVSNMHTRLIINASFVSGVFLFASSLYLVSFFGRKREIYYLYFSLFAVGLGLVAGGLNGLFQFLGVSFIHNSLLLNLGLAIMPFAMFSFSSSFFGFKQIFLSRFLALLLFATAASILCMYVYHPWFLYHARFVLPAKLAAILLALGLSIFYSLRGYRSDHAGSISLLGGFFIFLLAAANDIAVYARIYNGIHVVEYGFLALLIAMAGAASHRFSMVHHSLDQKIKEGEEIRSILIRSEQRYRQLIEGSREIILTVDGDGIIYSANDATRQYLGRRAETILGQSFFDFLHEEKSGQALGMILARDYFGRALQSDSPVQFPCAFRNSLGEPRELLVRLERLSGSENELLLLKISEQAGNVLMPYRRAERQIYVIGNYLTVPDLLSRRLVSDLINYMEPAEVHGIRSCLNEALLNAIEHGNLEIDFDTKTRVQADGTYLDFIKERQRDTRFNGRSVHVYYSLNSDRVLYRITDQGPGFDHEGAITRAREKTRDSLLQHGRGIILMLSAFSSVQYNARGNRVTLIKEFSPRA